MAKKATKKAAKKAAKTAKTVLVEWKPARLDDKEIASAFNVPVDDRQRQAWMQLLNDTIESAIAQTENPALANHHGLLSKAAGGQAALRAFKDAIEDRFDTAHDVLTGKHKEAEHPRGY